MYNEKFETLLTETKDIHNLKGMLYSRIKIFDIVKTSVLPKVVSQIQHNLYQDSNIIFINRKIHPNINTEYQGTPSSQNHLEKEE